MFLIFLGCYTVCSWLALVGGASFQMLQYFSLISFGVVFCIWGWKYSCEYKSTVSRHEYLTLSCFIFLAVFLVLFLHRPDTDDGTYLSFTIQFLEKPFQPISEFGFEIRAYSIAYEQLRAAISFCTGIPILYSYFMIGPVIIAVISTLMCWRFLQLLAPKYWEYAMFFYFVFMVSFGDVHRTHANFGFVRMYQGKALLVTLITVSIIYYFLKYRETLKKRYILLMFFSVLGGMGASPTGILVGILLIVCLAFTNIKFEIQALKETGLLLISILIPVCFGLFMKHYHGIQTNFAHAGAAGKVAHVTNLEMFKLTLGCGIRGIMVLLSFAISPICIQNKKISIYYRKFVFICILMLLFPWTSEVLAKNSFFTFSWRWLWIMPFPIIMSIVCASLIGVRFPNKYVGKTLYLSVILIFSFVPKQNLVISKENNTRIHYPEFKLWEEDKIYLRTYRAYGVLQGDKLYIKEIDRAF